MLEHMKRQVNNFKCRDAFCFWEKKIISKVRTMATAKNNEPNVIMLLVKQKCFTFVEHAPYWGLLFVLFFAVLCKTSKAKIIYTRF